MFNTASALAYSHVTALAGSPMAATGDVIDLNGSWGRFWGSITSTASIGRLMTLLSIIGVLIVAAALVKWAWDRRRGMSGGGGSGAVWGSLLVGAVLSAPNLLIPIVLQIFDILVNSIAKIWNATA